VKLGGLLTIIGLLGGCGTQSSAHLQARTHPLSPKEAKAFCVQMRLTGGTVPPGFCAPTHGHAGR